MSRGALYELLPAFTRTRDREHGQPLRALLEIFEEQLEDLEADLEQLYENWFIETCPPWVIPYIGDLLGLPNMGSGPAVLSRLRPLVGNLLRLRRGKGTRQALAGAASAATGWTVRATIFRNRLATTRHLGHLQAEPATNLDLRDVDGMVRLNTSFDESAHLADVREPVDSATETANVGKRAATYHPNRVGLFIWRDSARPLEKVVCLPRPDRPACYTFDPAGLEVPLFNEPHDHQGPEGDDDPSSVPGPVDPVLLIDRLRRHYRVITEGTAEERQIERDPLPFSIYLGQERVPAEQIRILELEDWQPRPAPPENKPLVLVDPQRGRFVLPETWSPDSVEVDCVVGSSGRVGAGPHDRRATISNPDDHPWFAMVARHLPHQPEGPRPTFKDLEQALEVWQKQGAMGAIRIMDNGYYRLSGRTLVLSGRERLHLEAGNGLRPFIDWQIVVELREAAVSLVFEGLLIKGTIAVNGTVERNSAGRIGFHNCTLVPSAEGPSLKVVSLTILKFATLFARLFPFPTPAVLEELVALVTRSERELMLQIDLDHCICGSIELLCEVANLTVTDSIVDAAGGTHAILANQLESGQKSSSFVVAGKRYPKPTTYAILTAERSTVLGEVHLHQIGRAVSCIFTRPVRVTQKAGGSFRYSYVPLEPEMAEAIADNLASDFCQPAQALDGVTSASERAAILTELQPDFVSSVYGQPGYCRLAVTTPEAITKGAEDGSEMGVYHNQRTPQIAINLQRILEEYTPFGTEIDIHFVT